LFNHHSSNIHPDINAIVNFSNILTINDRAGNLQVDENIVKNINLDGTIKCNHQFLFNNPDGACMLLPNGDAYLCCSDFGLSHRLGNLFEQSWNELMTSEAMKYVCDGLMDESKNILCRKCALATIK